MDKFLPISKSEAHLIIDTLNSISLSGDDRKRATILKIKLSKHIKSYLDDTP